MNGDGSVAQQNSQIAELILKKVDVLAVDAASETAVNGIIEKACKAGIIVVSFDSVASAPCNYQLNFDFKGYKATQAEAVFKMLGGKGNVIQVRGVKGSAPDNDMQIIGLPPGAQDIVQGIVVIFVLALAGRQVLARRTTAEPADGATPKAKAATSLPE